MPYQDGRLTPQEKKIAEAYAMTGDKGYAAYVAGVSPTSGAVHKALARPAVHAEMARRQKDIIFNDLLPLAVKTHKQMLESSATPAAARAKLIDLAYKHTLGAEAEDAGKEAHEMNADELAREISVGRSRLDLLEAVAGERARPIDDLQVVEVEQEGDIFA